MKRISKFLMFFSLCFCLYIFSACSLTNDGKMTPTLTIYDISKVYDGECVTANYSTNSSGVATILFKYQNSSDNTYSTLAPKNAGDYVIKISIAETEIYESISLTKEFSISKATPENGNDFTVPIGLVILSGQKLSTIDLSSYNLTWTNGELTITQDGTYYATFTPTDTANYETLSNIEIEVNVVSNLVSIPTLEVQYQYNGEIKTIETTNITNFDGSKMEIVSASSTFSAIDAGEYSIVIALIDKSSYAWSDGTTENKTLNWYINPIEIDEPTIANTTFDYDGTEKTLDLSYATDYLILSGKTSATDAGTYIVTFTLNDQTGNYVWAGDCNYVPLSYSWKINKKQITKVSATNASFKYSGSEQTLNVSYDNNYVSQIGTVSATQVGKYTATFSLNNENYCWSDGTSSDINISWNIVAIVVNLPTLTNVTQTYTGSNLSPTINYDSEHIEISDDSTTTATTKGIYSITFILKNTSNYLWSDGTNENKSYTWTISAEIASIPTLNISFDYDGEEKTVQLADIINFDSSTMKIVDESSVLTATEAGTYNIIIALLDTTNYAWGDGSIENKTLSWSIIDNSYSFTLTCNSGTTNCYLVSQDSTTNEYTITFNTISEDTSYSISGELLGNIIINADETGTYKFYLVLNGVIITSSYNSPIVCNSAKKFILNAKDNTSNTVTDNRENVGNDESQKSAVIYSEVDLNLSGSGTLNVVSKNNNGIHTKDDLEIKNQTLNVTCVDNAIKGNDEVSIESGTITLISTNGDGIKTSNNGLSSKGNQKGSVIIEGGTITIYCASDGIDSAYDVTISGNETVLNIYSTSEYAGSKVSSLSSVVSGTYYIIANSSYTYTYSIRYKTSSGYTMVNADTEATKTSSGYKYFAVSTVAGATSFEIYAYTSSQTQGSISTYYSKSYSKTLTSSYDSLKITSISSSSISASWTLYESSSSGNSDKLVYSAKGIKSYNEINISAGTICVYAYDDAIHANSDETIESTSSYGTGNVTLSGGIVTVKSHDDGIHADGTLTISGATITVLESYEGLEGTTIVVSSGTATVTASDDGVNAQSAINVSGGRLDVTVSPSGDTDGIDSNGTISITGGVVITRGPNNQNACPLDADRTISLTGGTIIVVGYISNSSSSGGGMNRRGGNPFGPGGQGGGSSNISTSLTKTQSSSSGLSSGSHVVTIGSTTISYTNSYSYSGYTTVYGSGTATIK